jgi:anthranilate/para-aminobenzoate synthase component II
VPSQTIASSEFLSTYPEVREYSSFIQESVVSFLESAGARVVPLILGESQDVTRKKLDGCSGVLFPGGGDEGYRDFGRFIWDYLIKVNDEGKYYPLFGICLGFEYMASYASDRGWGVLSPLTAKHTSLPLEFLPVESEMFTELGEKRLLFEKHAVSQNYHSWGISPQTFLEDEGLSAMFYPTSISYSTDTNKPFIASMESARYPFSGVQFHPEKPVGKFVEGEGTNHSWVSVQLNRYFADHFVNKARRNLNSFGDFSATQKEIIQNYDRIVDCPVYGMIYVFP